MIKERGWPWGSDEPYSLLGTVYLPNLSQSDMMCFRSSEELCFRSRCGTEEQLVVLTEGDL